MITNKEIDHGKAFDWGKASEDYAKYRDIYPKEFYQKIVDLGYCIKGQMVLDIGTGTGVLPRNMISFGAKWIGTDISKNQIQYAEKLSKGLDISYFVSSAENLDFENESFDVVTACQCFMYLDKSVILPKIHKFLKQDGHFLILFMAWLPYESEIAKASEDLVWKYNPSWTGGGLTRYEIGEPNWLGELFQVAHAITYDINVPFSRESWNGRMKACRGIDASLSPEIIRQFEKEHLKMLEKYPEHFDILHFATLLDLIKV